MSHVVAQSQEIIANIPGVVIAGGAARYIAMGAAAPEPADIDVFVLADTDALMVENTLAGLGYHVYHRGSPHTTVFKKTDSYSLPVQVVLNDGNAGRVWVSAEDVIATFGWTTEMFAVVGDAVRVGFVIGPTAVDDTNARVLRVNHIIDPVRLAYRAVKYGRKGYNLAPSDMQSIFDAFDRADPDDQARWRELNASNKGY